MNIVPQTATLRAHTVKALETIELAGRCCYQSEPNGEPEEFIRKIIRRGHESVLEHASATFQCITDRGVTHELVRHRIASFSQESTRYVTYDSGLTVIQPLNMTPEQINHWYMGCTEAELRYIHMLKKGTSAQIARSVLPTCTKAEIWITANFREWRHILKLRTASAAHPQMRDLMKQIKDQLVERWPSVFGDL